MGYGFWGQLKKFAFWASIAVFATACAQQDGGNGTRTGTSQVNIEFVSEFKGVPGVGEIEVCPVALRGTPDRNRPNQYIDIPFDKNGLDTVAIKHDAVTLVGTINEEDLVRNSFDIYGIVLRDCSSSGFSGRLDSNGATYQVNGEIHVQFTEEQRVRMAKSGATLETSIRFDVTERDAQAPEVTSDEELKNLLEINTISQNDLNNQSSPGVSTTTPGI